MRILVIEDDYLEAASISSEIEAYFSEAKIELIDAESVFFSQFQKIASSPPDIVIMDMVLRSAAPGSEILVPPRSLRDWSLQDAGWRCAKLLTTDERTKHIPLIIHSIFDRDDLKFDFKELGQNVFFVRKDFDSKYLIRAIRALKTAMPTLNSTTSEGLKVFLCHSTSDKKVVRELYHRFRTMGLAPWLDEEDLLPGQDWQQEIPKAVRNSDIFIVCLSKKAISKRGYIQKEIKYALDVADEQPENTIFIIPLKLEECEIPDRLSRWQWVNYFEEKGFERLMKSLHSFKNS